MADPLPIALTFLGTELRDMTQLDSILTVVDAEACTSELFKSKAVFHQVLYSDIILLNKTDLISEVQIAKLEEHIRSIKEGARMLRCEYSQVPLSLILDINLSASGSSKHVLTDSQENPASSHLQNDGFMTVSFQSDRPFAIKKFQQFLDYQLPEAVFRAKGVLWFAESPRRHLFQLSGKRFTINDSEWASSPKTQMVLSGRNLDPLYLQQTLNNCLTR